MLRMSFILVIFLLLYIDNASGFFDFRPISVSREQGSNRNMGNKVMLPILDFVSPLNK